MIVSRLSLKNFLSHKNSEISLERLGVVLVDGENRDRGGSNGAGKTALVEGLYWCLFGQMLRPVKVADISYDSKGNCKVTATIKLDDSNTVVVTRTQGCKGEQPLTLEIDGVDVSAGTATETQKKLNSLLRMDAKTFKQIVLFTGEQDVFAALTDKGQKEILDSILGLDRLPKAYEKVAEQLKQFRLKRADLDMRVQNLASQIEAQQKTVERLDESYDGFNKSKALAVKQAQAEVIKLAAAEPAVSAETVKLVEEGQLRLAELQEKLGPLHQNSRAAVEKLTQSKVHKVKLETDLVYANKRVVLWKDPVDADALIAEKSTCPTCSQALPASALRAMHKAYVKKEEERKVAHADALKEVGRLQVALNEANKEIAKLQDQANVTATEAEEYTALKYLLAEKRGELVLAKSKHASWAASLELAKKNLASAKAQENPFVPLLAVAKRDASVLKDTHAKAKADQEKLDEEQAYLDFWQLGFSNKGVKGLILDTITPYLNDRANHYLQVLSAGTARVEFMTHTRSADNEVKEKFDVEAGYAFGASSYDGASRGERRRVDLACLFALGDLAAARAGSKLELRMLDEPFEHVDGVGHQEVVRLLSALAPEVGTLLVTSHEDGIRQLLDKKITVVKHRGVSSVH